jgi:hypothetical protein
MQVTYIFTEGQAVESPYARRKYRRIRRNLKAKVKLIRSSTEIEGLTRDLSQGGAFIEISSWSAFHENDQAKIQLFLPPEFTGQKETMVLVGPAVVKRIEGDRGGIAVQFLKELKTFEVLRQPILG